jgi:signal transduction histidine kinase
VAKTLHGLALSAEALAVAADSGTDPRTLKSQATAVAGAARRAATESRELLSDLRAHTAMSTPPTDMVTELAARVRDFTARTGTEATFTHLPTPTSTPALATPTPTLPPSAPRQLLAIASEALENAHRHANATHVRVTLECSRSALRLTVRDDGAGTAVSLDDVDALANTGHFGLLGMLERAASVAAELQLHSTAQGGTEVTLTVPLASTVPEPPAHSPQEEAAHA